MSKSSAPQVRRINSSGATRAVRLEPHGLNTPSLCLKSFLWENYSVVYFIMQYRNWYASDNMSGRLRRWTRNPLGSARRGSIPLAVVSCRWSYAEQCVCLRRESHLHIQAPASKQQRPRVSYNALQTPHQMCQTSASCCQVNTAAAAVISTTTTATTTITIVSCSSSSSSSSTISSSSSSSSSSGSGSGSGSSSGSSISSSISSSSSSSNNNNNCCSSNTMEQLQQPYPWPSLLQHPPSIMYLFVYHRCVLLCWLCSYCCITVSFFPGLHVTISPKQSW